MSYRLLDAFEGLFNGQPYHHRKSNLGDLVGFQLFEDLCEVRRSRKFADVSRQDRRRLGQDDGIAHLAEDFDLEAAGASGEPGWHIRNVC